MIVCGWCRSEQLRAHGAIYCSRKCRQSAFRLRRRVGQDLGDAKPGVLDDVFPGTGVIGRAWDSLSSAAGAGRRLSPLQHDDATAGVSPVHDGDSAAVAGVLL